MKKKLPFIFVFIALCIFNVRAQSERNPDLFIELRKQDSIFFERAFNQCDLEYLENHVTDDLKFFHDQGGFQNKEVFLQRVKENICGNPNQKPVRKVDVESLEVFPLYNNGVLYGAIQTGIHRFYLREKGKEDVYSSVAKFTHVWVIVNGTWKISEVLSYEHK